MARGKVFSWPPGTRDAQFPFSLAGAAAEAFSSVICGLGV